LLYCGANISLCALEILAHSGAIPRNKVLIEVELPDDLDILALDDASLPPDWDAPVDQDSTKDLGTRWAEGKATAVMSVPSAIVRKERNYLINPLHPDFSRIRFSSPEPFVFDPRLKR